MEIPPLVIQSGVSLFAILALFWLARALKLGGKPRITEAEQVNTIADQVEDGFTVARTSVSRNGDAALAADASGRIMLIKRHGNQFPGRILTSSATVREEVDGIVVDCGEVRFGAVRLSIEDPGYWVDAINRL